MKLRLLWIDIEQWKDNNIEGATCGMVRENLKEPILPPAVYFGLNDEGNNKKNPLLWDTTIINKTIIRFSSSTKSHTFIVWDGKHGMKVWVESV